MNLLQMSFSGAIMIFAVMMVRVVAINKLPKNVFVLLWEMVLLRLLVPFSVPSSFSAYSLVAKIPLFAKRITIIQDIFSEVSVNTDISQISREALKGQHATAVSGVLQEQFEVNFEGMLSSIFPWDVIWVMGMILCGIFFAVSYFRCCFEFRTSLPVKNEVVNKWLENHSLRRPLQIRQSERISAPLTYGILRPIILMPKGTDWENMQQLQYILLHEYVHICRFDMVVKLITVLTLCIHWFNPMVWMLYFLLNRDIELSCDENVVHRFGENTRASYARILIAMEEKKSGLMPFYNNFSKNAIEERITSIMKIKKVTMGAVLISVVLLVIMAVLFATSAKQVQPITGKHMIGEDKLKIIGEVEETKDRKIVYEMAKEVTEAYFQGDLETIKKYLVADYTWTIDTYLDSGRPYGTDTVTIYGIKGLSHIEEKIGESYTVQVEFLPTDDDSLWYFSMDFEKQEYGWRISNYGLEK